MSGVPIALFEQVDRRVPRVDPVQARQKRVRHSLQHLEILSILLGALFEILAHHRVGMILPGIVTFRRRGRRPRRPAVLGGLRLPDHGVELLGRHAADRGAELFKKILLHRVVLLAEPVREALRQPSGIEQQAEGVAQVLLDRVKPRDLRLAHLARGGDVLAHAARKLNALALELIQQLRHALGLFGQIRRAHHAGGAVGVDQPQLAHGVGRLAVLDDAGHAVAEHVAAAVADQEDRGAAPVSGDDHVLAFDRPHAQRVQQADRLDVRRQLVDAVDRIKVVRIRTDQVEVDPHDLLLAVFIFNTGVLQVRAQIKAFLRHHSHRLSVFAP